MTTAQARQQWAQVLRSAERGTPIIVTSHGQAVAAVVSIEQLRRIEQVSKETLAEALERTRSRIAAADLEGPDPWSAVRDPTRGREVEVE